VATPGDVDDEPIPVLPITQRATQGGHMNRELRRLDKGTRPDPSHQVLLTDELATAFKQNNQDLQSMTSKGNLLLAFQQKKRRNCVGGRRNGANVDPDARIITSRTLTG
jgi:hypothetical protein